MPELKRPMINDALRLVRLYWGYSQADLAKDLDLSQSMISEIERGAKAVTLDVLERYSGKLGIRMSQLLFFAEELETEPAQRRGKLLVAGHVLKLLENLAPVNL
ncbi:DNA-binding transcriptional regulator, XRE-family HTH domain [Devosia enhydra]|uniref:DNA-binding transcriptional regulator, XRE-family HTH domain n=1 Tax=Devosia enhydra TaxID=665118 RepID=A0A1K2HVP7_9HYPH|nr:helix-turn-helix transcriptional regulator [Devosia enhydra]SFZ82889.1 DNA-binding transcriptional regulator, XRE-family HTH domain [Devosia enhydra]